MNNRSRFKPSTDRWLHVLAALLAQVSRAERLDDANTTVASRRLRQRLATAQRLLDPLPAPLMAPDRGQERFWVALRWGGAGMAIALWLHR